MRFVNPRQKRVMWGDCASEPNRQPKVSSYYQAMAKSALLLLFLCACSTPQSSNDAATSSKQSVIGDWVNSDTSHLVIVTDDSAYYHVSDLPHDSVTATSVNVTKDSVFITFSVYPVDSKFSLAVYADSLSGTLQEFYKDTGDSALFSELFLRSK